MFACGVVDLNRCDWKMWLNLINGIENFGVVAYDPGWESIGCNEATKNMQKSFSRHAPYDFCEDSSGV